MIFPFQVNRFLQVQDGSGNPLKHNHRTIQNLNSRPLVHVRSGTSNLIYNIYIILIAIFISHVLFINNNSLSKKF